MNEETLEALKDSIKSWKARAAGETGWSCALCRRFRGSKCFIERTREACPVTIQTSFWGCGRTPYDDWRHHHYIEHQREMWEVDMDFLLVPFCEECKRLAQIEVEFLESLLPEGEDK